MTKSKRLLVLIRRLEQGRKIRPTNAAKVLGTTKRTIFRDLKSLKEMGIPIITSDGHYRLDSEKWKDWLSESDS